MITWRIWKLHWLCCCTIRHIAHTHKHAHLLRPTHTPHTPKKRYREWRLATPFITRATLQLLVALWALSWVVDLAPWVVNVPALTILRLQCTFMLFGVGRWRATTRRD
jgi:hypothetical protein